MTTYVYAKNTNTKNRLIAYSEKRHLGHLEFVKTPIAIDTLQLNDIIIVERLGDLFNTGKDAIEGLELLKSLWIELHVVEFEKVAGDGKVTFSPIGDLLPIVIKQVTEWQSERVSKRNKQVKRQQREKSLYRGGRKEKGFTVRKVGRKQIQIVDERDKAILERILEFKKMRDSELSENNGKTVKWSLRYIHNQLKREFDMEWKKEITDSKGKKKRVEKFGLATLYRLIDDDYHNNAKARLERIATISDIKSI